MSGIPRDWRPAQATQGNESDEAPEPRDARLALLDAARRLAGDKSGRPFGVREVARAAGVNHALVYRYYGSLEGLLEAATADREAMTLRLLDEPGTDGIVAALFDVALEQPFVAVRLAELPFEASHEGWAQHGALIRRIRDRVAELHPEMGAEEATARTASLAAMALGYVLYESFLATALEWQAEDRATIRAHHRDLLRELLTRP
jgi:AcrR family transcriptional regulator